MRCCLLAVLLLAVAVGWAQPLQGPSVLLAFPDTVTAENLFVTLREDSMADLFYQVGNSVFHAVASLESGSSDLGTAGAPGARRGLGPVAVRGGVEWFGNGLVGAGA